VAFPADLRLWHAFFRVAPRGYGLARWLWQRRLRSLGVVAMPATFGFTTLLEIADYHGWSIAMHGTHEPPITALVCRELRSGDVFVDVGANHGWFSLLAAHRLQPIGGKVFAFEPQSKLSSLLRRSAEINHLDNLVVIQAAAGDRASRGAVYLPSPDQTRYGSLFPAGAAVDAVDVVTLDHQFPDLTPTLLKIDVEGFEVRVLRGMKGLLARSALRGLIIEVHPPEIARFGDETPELLQTLGDHGFRLYYVPMTLRNKAEPELRDLTPSCLAKPCFNLFAKRD
jgi:FkbM family methyltransferase